MARAMMMIRRTPPPIPAPIPAFAPTVRPLLAGTEVEVDATEVLSPSLLVLEVGSSFEVVATAAPTVDGDGFALSLINIASVG